MIPYARLTLCSLLSTVVIPALAQQQVSAEGAANQAASADANAPAKESTDPQAVIVTGSRSAKAVDKVAGAVTVVSAAEVKRNLVLTEDATSVLARTVPGYSESNQTLNTLGETLRGRAALYLFDGVPQSTPLRDGNRNATFTDMATVERIEVISGASASEGIGAAGGIINYISKRATEEGTHYGIDARLGSQFGDDSNIYKLGGTISHKSGAFDLFAAASYLDRGITYDAKGRRIGISASSSIADSTQRSLFLKSGLDFGENNSQRLEVTGNYFKIQSKGDYHYVGGSRQLGVPDTAEPGRLVSGSGQVLYSPDFNDFRQLAVNYNNDALLGGSLVTTLYVARQAMRYPGDTGTERQDPLIATPGTLFDQSEILSNKHGLRTSFTRPDLFVQGLEMRAGVDVTHDETSQRQALTNRVYVPPMNYNSVGPYMQASFDRGPVTLSAGYRYEAGTVKVQDYTTLYYYGRANVTGGTLKYDNGLPNAGAVVRFGGGLSGFVTYGEGFTLPNLGTILRSQTKSVSVDNIFSTSAVVFKNKEIGLNLRRELGSLGVSYYVSNSKLGSTLTVDQATQQWVVNRRPVEITGIDATGELRASSTLRLNLLYSHVVGKTSASNGSTGPLNTRLGMLNISPDKLNGSVTWTPNANASVTFGETSIFDRNINAGKPTEEHTKGYTLFDLTANYRVQGAGQFSLGIENLLNRYYILSSSQIDIYQNYFAGRGRTMTLTYHNSF